jgi:Carboxypeptidase regulatory-like domain
VNSAQIGPGKKRCDRNVGSSRRRPLSLARLSLSILLCGSPALAQSQPPPIVPGALSGLAQRGFHAAANGQTPEPPLSGTISGTVVDRTGTAVSGAHIRLTPEVPSRARDVLTGDEGQFSFADLPPGAFQLSITAEGFATQASSGTLRSGQSYVVPQITLAVATAITEVRVELSPIELAQEQLKDQEKQRVFGFIPNFYVSYVPNAAPLTSKQKFQLAWKSTVDPVTFGLTGAVAGIEQAQDRFSGYGQGAQGYAKRYGATYADLVTNTFIGGAILPSLLKQDPRYFYKGTGSKRSRSLYAIANSVICKGDNGHWQANYSAILGSLAAGGISNLYYPASDRNGAALTFENALIGIGASAATNLLQEFVIRRLTPNLPNYTPATP